MNSGYFRNALVLGLLTAIGPFAIDMYLPALPSIGASIGAGPDAVLMSLTAFFITFAIGQFVYGPASDMIGRKPPLYFGVALFALASVGCALATDIETLIAFRVIQGLGGAAGMVIARAIVRDLHSGIEETRLLSLLMLVFSVSPLFAPLIGSIIIELAGWRAIFWLVTIFALAGLVLTALFVPETRPRAARADSNIASVLAAVRVLARDWNFLSQSLVGAFAIAGFFVFLANSSFIFMNRYGLSALEYSFVFSINAAAFFIAMQMNGWLGERFGLARIVRPAAIGYAVAMALVFALAAAGFDNLFGLVALLFVGYGFVGFIVPVTSVLALASHGSISGTAASMMSTLQLVIGAGIIALSGIFADGTFAPMAAGIAACALISCTLALIAPGLAALPAATDITDAEVEVAAE
jgi:DHA1 family bicyclomycin/chloramphenicol resistance-like MFS transporter